VIAAQQTMAWSDSLRMAMKEVATSHLSGGFRTEWLDELVIPQEGYTGTFFGGLFSAVNVNIPTDDWASLGTQLFGDPNHPGENVAADLFGAAVNFISSNTGAYGAILKAIVDIGRFFLKLGERAKTPIFLMTVPWQEYSKATDQDFVNMFVMPLMKGVDWTGLFAPPMDPADAQGFLLAKTDEGEHTRAYGVFGAGERPGPIYLGSTYGFMPGTQQMAEVMQMAETGSRFNPHDAITNVGTFYPSVSQYATAAENLINRVGSADMFKIQPASLEQQWQRYFDAYFGQGFDELARFMRGKTDVDYMSSRLLAKALWQFIVGTARNGVVSVPALGNEWRATAGNLQHATNAGLFREGGHPEFYPQTRYSPIHTTIVLPALRELRQRQMSALAHSLVCAYVRCQQVGNLPAFAAFEDPGPNDPTLPHGKDPGVTSWGKQLRVRCEMLRAKFLTHLDRYKVKNQDAIDVDPVFGRQLADSKQMAPEFPIRGRAAFEPLDPQTPEAPPSTGPTGGAPMSLTAATEPDKPAGISTPTKVAFGSVAAAGALAGLGLHMTGR
jgi:hypothetical protein